jgi:hypothetical protein
VRVILEEDLIVSGRKPVELHVGVETPSAGYPDAQSRSGVVDRAATTWAARSAGHNACTTTMVSSGTAEVTASDLSVAWVRAVDTTPLMGSPSRAPSSAAGRTGTPSMVPSSSEELFSPGSLSGIGSVGTALLVEDVDAGADDGVAAHGRSIAVESVSAWAAYSVEQDAGTMVLVVYGAPGATVRGFPMAGARAGESHSLADAVRSPDALSAEHDMGDRALVPMGAICTTASGVALVGARGGRRRGSRSLSHRLLISALHSSR